jgi:hypothetical protein
VLQDARTEAWHASRYNPWLNYAVPLHAAREFGLRCASPCGIHAPADPSSDGCLWRGSLPILEQLGERRLYPSEIRQVCELIFGTSLPDPETAAPSFVVAVEDALRNAPLAFNPFRRAAAPWIDIDELDQRLNPQCVDRMLGMWSLDRIVKCLA